MASIPISDDDDSFEEPTPSKNEETYMSDDSIGMTNSPDSDKTEVYSVSDDEDPSISSEEKKKIVKTLFPEINKDLNDNKTNKSSKVKKMIGGIEVILPVDPYGSQIALMAQVITAIKKGQNCLLESPTGSGKTLALLCGALAWQSFECNRTKEIQNQEFFLNHPELQKIDGVAEYVGTPYKKNSDVTPEKLFGKPNFGERSIYDNPASSRESSPYGLKRNNEKLNSPGRSEDTPKKGEVKIHKRARFHGEENINSSSELQCTPEKVINVEQPDTPSSVRKMYELVRNLNMKTSMLVDYSVPTIYYGARTHKQLQQVIKEFGRTVYCEQISMALLSSRANSCLREFDKQSWKTREEMCKSCIKKVSNLNERTSCEYYDNRKRLDHTRLPSAFDLEDLNRVGEELKACPFYAARAMAQTAQIIFCPYNYLIEPSIRSSLQIDLENNIVIIDEAHNIEDHCREAATFSFTREQIQAALKELSVTIQYRFSNSEGENMWNNLEKLIKTLENWDYWFKKNQTLLKPQSGTNNETVYPWEAHHFVETLKNQNLGQHQFHEFQNSADKFCKSLREDPHCFYGVTQATGTLLETINVALGYLFRDNNKYLNDFKPVLVEKETLTLRLVCLNAAIVFEGLKSAKCIILASGTLTPLKFLHAELATDFPLKLSANHIIPQERVWIGTLSTCKDGRKLECNSSNNKNDHVQDAIGEAILHVCRVTPHGVLAFFPSYSLVDLLIKRWEQTGVWKKLQKLKYVFKENRNGRTHQDIMECFYEDVATDKGAILFAVYRGKVSEGMDFKDHQARAVITVGVPYPNLYEVAVSAKKSYNQRYAREKSLPTGEEWLNVQAFRALNQAVGRCVRHRGDWGAVLLIDSRFTDPHYTEHLSKWLKNMLGNNHFTFETLLNSRNNLEAFMKRMTLEDAKDV